MSRGGADTGAGNVGNSRAENALSGTVAALGEPALLAGFRLAGAVPFPATGEAEVRAAWTRLPESVAAVLLTPAAALALAAELADPGAPLTAVLPRPVPPQ